MPVRPTLMKFSANLTLMFKGVLDLLERGGHGGWVGPEYNPSTARTEESLGWIKELGHA